MIKLLLALSLISSSAMATCDFKTGIQKLPDGNYEYTKECHIAVGQLVQDNKTQAAQIVEYKAAINLYQVTIKTDEERIQNWIATSTKLESRVEKVDDLEKKNEWLYFGLGVLATAAAAYTGEKLAGH
jgi:hypothetical protein